MKSLVRKLVVLVLFGVYMAVWANPSDGANRVLVGNKDSSRLGQNMPDGTDSSDQPLGKAAKRALTFKPRPTADPTRIKDFGYKPYTRLSKLLPHVESKPWKLVCELPYNAQFQPWIELDSPARKKLLFNSTNPLVLYLTPTESCEIQPGVHGYEARKWVSGEGAIYTIPAGVTVKAVKYHETGYNAQFRGSFQCNDEDYNILWRRAARTAYLTMRDHFYDCPDRERVGFWGDGTPELDQYFYIFDPAHSQICKDLVLRKLEPDFYPGQHLEFLGEYGLWFYYQQTGDLESLRKVYEPTKQFLLHTYKFGNKGTWFDWGVDSKDTSVIENCFMYIDLGTLRKIAALTEHASDIPEIDARREAIKASFDRKFWRGRYYQSSDVEKPDDRANAMAINAGLADRQKWESIYSNVLSRTTNSSCFFDRWVFEALTKIGKPEAAMLRMVNRYRTMIDSPITTLWEHYDRWWASWINAFDEGSSLNHGWNPPVILLSKVVAGVQPVEAGWSVFEVKPTETFLHSIRVSVPTVKGDVRVHIQKSAYEYRIQVAVPPNTQAIVGIPRASFHQLFSIGANERLVWENGSVVESKSVTWLGERDGYLQFEVGPGAWNFVAEGELPTDTVKLPGRALKPEVPLDKRDWTATASVPDSTFLFSGAKIPIDISANNALDGDDWTGWRDMTATQHPGQWFQVDMKRPQTFNRIVLDNTWALWDSPNSYSVKVSDDGIHWSPSVALGKGHLGITTIRFPMQTARFIRITQTGSDPTYHWSIYELNVLKSAR